MLCHAALCFTCIALPWQKRASCPGVCPTKCIPRRLPVSYLQSPAEAGSRQASLRQFQHGMSVMCGHLELCPSLAVGLAAGRGSLLELLAQLGCSKAGCPAGVGEEQVGGDCGSCTRTGLRIL